MDKTAALWMQGKTPWIFAIFADRQKFAMGPREALAAVLLFVALSQQGCEDYYRCLDLGKFSIWSNYSDLTRVLGPQMVV